VIQVVLVPAAGVTLNTQVTSAQGSYPGVSVFSVITITFNLNSSW